MLTSVEDWERGESGITMRMSDIHEALVATDDELERKRKCSGKEEGNAVRKTTTHTTLFCVFHCTRKCTRKSIIHRFVQK